MKLVNKEGFQERQAATRAKAEAKQEAATPPGSIAFLKWVGGSATLYADRLEHRTGPFKNLTTLPVSAITEVKRSGIMKTIKVSTSTETVEILNNGSGDPDAFVAALNEARAPKTAALVQAVSSADELAKFAALRDQGVITDEDFEAKKRHLLGI